MARSKILSLGAVLACAVLASSLLFLNIAERTVSESLGTREMNAKSIYGVYRSDLGEEIKLHEDGTYSYQKVLATGKDYNFSGQFYFSEEENFESGELGKVIKFKNYASTFDVWRDDKLTNQIPATFQLDDDSSGAVKFCNYGGLDGDYNCFRPAQGLP
jgi:hypothetical protein